MLGKTTWIAAMACCCCLTMSVKAQMIGPATAAAIAPAERICHDNDDCRSRNTYCAKKAGDCDGPGVCRRKPQFCPAIYDPVCGCDGNTYGNACEAAANGVNVAHEGTCEQICGGILGLPCDDGEFCKLPDGQCCCDFTGICTPIPNVCPDVWDPVCGCDGMTYGNECEASAAGVSVDHRGTCERICGGIQGLPCDDGEFCKLPDGQCCCDFTGICMSIPNVCPDVWDPVCGCDGMTYGNECEASAAGVSVDHRGECGTGACCLMGGQCIQTTEEDCTVWQCGFYQGNGTDCASLPYGCPIVRPIGGACCLPNGSCTETFECDCNRRGGTWQGDFTNCDAADIDCGGEICGGIAGIPCSDPNDFCKLPEGECCCDFFGLCTPIPQFCPLYFDPVCGCDGMTYGNECLADAAGVSVDHHGFCNGGCQDNSECYYPLDPFGRYCFKAVGDCDGVGNCEIAPQYCLDVWDPVCGCDGVTYSNSCYAGRVGVNVKSEGPCEGGPGGPDQ